jgi:hypothetical protein
MTTPTPPLSPAAQAVWDAWNDAYEAQGPLEDMGHPLAAGLIAAVSNVSKITTLSGEEWVSKRQLLALAAELRQEGRE